MNDLNINGKILADFDIIEKDIMDINETITDIYKSMLKLDESVWKAREKDKIDQEFMPYLKKYSEKYSNYLMYHLNFARDAVNKHIELDKQMAKLEDIEII